MTASERAVWAFCLLAFICVALSPTGAGFALRAAVAVPLCWLGAIDFATGERIALFGMGN